MININPVQTGLRKFNFLKKQNLNLINYFILFLALSNQVKGQFNINPSSKLKDRLNSLENNQYYANQLQNHRITDYHISDQITDTKPPNDNQFVQSNPIRVEDNKKQTDSTLPNTDQSINRYTTDTAYTPINEPNMYSTDSNNRLINSINPSTNSISSITQTNPISTIGSTIGSYSTNLITSESSNSNTISDHNNYAPNYDTYPNSQAITKTQLGRLQSTTPDTAQQDFQNSPQSNRFGGMNQQQYSQNNMMGSPSLISSIFSKFNQPMGTYYPYGNFGNYGMYNYQNSYYPSYYGSMYGSGNYPGSMYGGSGGGGGGNFIQQAFYAKMRPIMNFFQRLTGKFNSPYSMYGAYSPYAGTYTNGLYNYGGDVYRNPLYKSNLFQKDVLTRKLDNVRNLGRNLLPNLQNSISSQNLNLQNSQENSNLKSQILQSSNNSKQPTNLQASGTNQFSSVHSSNFERRNAVEDNFKNNLKAIAKLRGLDGKLHGEILFEQQQNQSDSVIINGELNNLSPGGHGLHIHEFGSLNSECTDYAIGAHYNPTQSQHGGLNTEIRHYGDLGNLFTDVNGVSRISNLKTNLSLIGQNSILKRTIAVTENVDDLGEKDSENSKLNGNSGKVIACGYIEFVN